MNDDWYRLVQLALPEKGIYRISRKGSLSPRCI